MLSLMVRNAAIRFGSPSLGIRGRRVRSAYASVRLGSPESSNCDGGGTQEFQLRLPHQLEPPFGNCVRASPDHQRGADMSKGDRFSFTLGIATGTALLLWMMVTTMRL
jgi:hypothetical protein